MTNSKQRKHPFTPQRTCLRLRMPAEAMSGTNSDSATLFSPMDLTISPSSTTCKVSDGIVTCFVYLGWHRRLVAKKFDSTFE